MAGQGEVRSMTPRIHELASDWRECFGRAMEGMADCRPAMELLPDAPGNGSKLWWKQQLDAAPGAAIWVGAPTALWSAFGQKILSAAGIDTDDQEEQKGAYLEVLRQSLSALATAIGAQLGREVVAGDGSEEEPSGAVRCRVGAALGSDVVGDFWFAVNGELVDAFPVPAASAPVMEDEPLGLSPRACGTLNLLLDVELPVSVSFGRTQIRIQEVLKLITGSIIELDRSISEPVEVIVNNCVVARGEVVVVDGNYGVRIQEVMSRQDRLKESRKFLLPVNRAS
jgi:flagellar motor switch protein FliN/FliY